jgi:hypothetical protein
MMRRLNPDFKHRVETSHPNNLFVCERHGNFTVIELKIWTGTEHGREKLPLLPVKLKR